MRSITPAYRISFCALMAGLGTAFMFLSNVIPIFTYVSPLLASLTLIPVLVEFWKKYAWMTWVVTTILSLILCSDREAAFFYLYIGYYPIIKPDLDRIKAKPARIIAKLAIFAGAVTIMVLTLSFIVGLNNIREEMWLNIAFYAMMVGVMLLFDRTYGSMAIIYERRLRRFLVRNGRYRT